MCESSFLADIIKNYLAVNFWKIPRGISPRAEFSRKGFVFDANKSFGEREDGGKVVL